MLAEAHDPDCRQAALAEQVCAELGAMAGLASDLLWTNAELMQACQLAGFDQTEIRLAPAPGSSFTTAEEAANREAASCGRRSRYPSPDSSPDLSEGQSQTTICRVLVSEADTHTKSNS